MATIIDLDNGAVRVQIRRKGLPNISETFRAGCEPGVETPAQVRRYAKAWGAATERAMLRGEWKDKRAAQGKLLRDVADEYLRHVYPDGATPKRRDPMLPAIIRDVCAKWGDYALSNISPEAVGTWRDQLLKSGRVRGGGGLSASSVNKLLARLSALYTFAAKTLHLPVDNPVSKASYAVGEKTKERRRFHDDGEEARLLEAMTKPQQCRMYRYGSKSDAASGIKGIAYIGTLAPSPLARLAVIVAMEAGLREDEIASLRIDKVQIAKRTATTELTKNGTIRDVPLPPRALAAIQAAIAHGLARAAEQPDDDQPKKGKAAQRTPEQIAAAAAKRAAAHDAAKKLVFGGLTGKQLWRYLRVAADSIGSTDLDFHCLRHEAASRLAPKYQLQELMAIMGWKSLEMVKTNYHARASELAERLHEPASLPATIDPATVAAVIAAMQASGFALVKQEATQAPALRLVK